MPTAAQELERFLRGISFRLVPPSHPRDPAQRLVLERPGREPATVLELFGSPFDAINTELPAALKRRLRPLLDVPRMSTLATAAILNRAVATMPPGQAFVNVGVWQGFTFLAGMAGNPDATCVGVDNFSEFYGPRDAFTERFEARRGPAHRFFDMDYREYFEQVHEGTIGVYLYDGEHSYENQMRGLEAAEPFLADDCVLVVDDTNRADPRNATLDFIARRPGEYGLAADIWTAANNHPTFWNGLLVLRRGGRDDPLTYPAPAEHGPPAPAFDVRKPAVSLVVLDEGEGSDAALAAARAQSWQPLEVVVADAREQDAGPALRDALARTSGDMVAFVEGSVEPAPETVALSVAYPDATPFWRPVDESRVQRGERGLKAAADLDGIVPPDAKYVVAGDALGMPATAAAGPGTHLMTPAGALLAADEHAVLEAIESHRAGGAGHLVVMWTHFDWLGQRPGVRAWLGSHSEEVLANRRLRVYRL